MVMEKKIKNHKIKDQILNMQNIKKKIKHAKLFNVFFYIKKS